MPGRRSSKPDLSQPPELPEPGPDPAALAQRVTRLTNELELAELRYERDVKELKLTIAQLQEEMERLAAGHLIELDKQKERHFTLVETLKRAHTEELALYAENCEKEQHARVEAETLLSEYKLKMRFVNLPDVELLKVELARLQGAYAEQRVAHEQEVVELEERIGELLAEIAAHNERSRPRFQLIPDRTYIVTKSPTVSSTSVGSVGSDKTSRPVRPKSAHPGLQLKSPELATPELSKVRTARNTESHQSEKAATDKGSARPAAVPNTNSHLETIEKPKSIPLVRPKSCTAKKVSQKQEKQARPNSCWGDRRPVIHSQSDRPSPDRSISSQNESKCSAFSQAPRLRGVRSKIDTGGKGVVHGLGGRYKPVRGSSLGGNAPPWQAASNTRYHVARSNFF